MISDLSTKVDVMLFFLTNQKKIKNIAKQSLTGTLICRLNWYNSIKLILDLQTL